ncbi:FAD-dependent oxidoreductase [Pseudofulvibacter geojedonensis]|uniref:FAD-dependent oxidoreductase n=1 Tax=Pseudofulvibacter geojedonensis TaxID=1123758 RepID=A0ABW3I3R4_9FLAO
MYDVLIIGAGAAGMSCALVIGSALEKPFAINKKVGLIAHQRSSHLQNALFNNVLGLQPGTLGEDLLKAGTHQLAELYPKVEQIAGEKILEIKKTGAYFEVISNKNTYATKALVIATGYAKPFTIEGLEEYLEAHQMAKPGKERIQLKNHLHLVDENLYVAGTLAGWRSQFAIACGSGAQVATDILTLWNNGEHTKVHDKKPQV